VIELSNLTKYYGKQAAVEDLSFRVREGETFGLIGTSGCGKTTTLKMINRLVEPTSGIIRIDGQKSTLQPPERLRRNIGYVIQDVGLFPHYSVRQNIATVPRLLGWNEQQIIDRSDELLELVGLPPEVFANRKPAALSGGQQQRVGLARALAADPSIILMDEPFGALDPITKEEIREQVSAIFRRIKKTIVLVTHDVIEAFAMCDRLCLLDQGKVQQIGAPKELLFQPENAFVRSFFASNRFQLELLSVSIADILEGDPGELYWSPPLKEEEEPQINPSESLYALVEKLEKASKEDTVIIHRREGKVHHTFGFSDLLNRFHAYKKQIRSGWGRDDD